MVEDVSMETAVSTLILKGRFSPEIRLRRLPHANWAKEVAIHHNDAYSAANQLVLSATRLMELLTGIR
jgi:hypothetical protein